MRYAIDPADRPALRFGVNIIRVRRIFPSPKAVPAEHVFPTRIADAAGIRRIAHPTAVVLQTAIDVIRLGIVYADVIELRNGQIHRVRPACAAVLTAPEAAIVAGEDGIGIAGVDPDIVKIAVRAARNRTEALAAVHAE